MYVYIYYPKFGNPSFQGFHKAEKAAEAAILTIENIAISKPAVKSKKKNSELEAIEQNVLVMEPPAVEIGADIFDDVDADAPAAPAPVGGNPPMWFRDVKKKAKKTTKIDCGELQVLKDEIFKAKKNMTVESANKVIELYDDYAKYVLNNECIMHAIKQLDDGKLPPKKEKKSRWDAVAIGGGAGGFVVQGIQARPFAIDE